MPVESGSYISDLNPAWPLGADDRNQGDDHLRLVKRLVQQSFPNVEGAVTVTQLELNSLDGVSAGQTVQQQIDDLKSAGVAQHNHAISDVTGLQTALNSKAALSSPSFSGVPTAPTPATSNNSGQIATTAYVTAVANGIEVPDTDPYVHPTLCTFFPVNRSTQLPVGSVATYNVGFIIENFPASVGVQIMYSFRGFWQNLDLRTDSQGYAVFSQEASAFRSAWIAAGGGLGLSYFRIRPDNRDDLVFTQDVYVT